MKDDPAAAATMAGARETRPAMPAPQAAYNRNVTVNGSAPPAAVPSARAPVPTALYSARRAVPPSGTASATCSSGRNGPISCELALRIPRAAATIVSVRAPLTVSRPPRAIPIAAVTPTAVLPNRRVRRFVKSICAAPMQSAAASTVPIHTGRTCSAISRAGSAIEALPYAKSLSALAQ